MTPSTADLITKIEVARSSLASAVADMENVITDEPKRLACEKLGRLINHKTRDLIHLIAC